MKRLSFLPSLIFSLLALTACSSEFDNTLNSIRRAKAASDDIVFYATVEGAGQADAQTKVYADDQMRVLWNADDRITVFNKYTYGYEYLFKGGDGDNAGVFEKVPNDDMVTGNTLGFIYAVYPHNPNTKISNDGVLTVTLPASQSYKENSFGIGANTMVSVTGEQQLHFRNAGGYLSFKFYGDAVSIKSITLCGNNHEKLAGAATITMEENGLPTLAMLNTATESVTLNCETPVAIGSSIEDFTEFWFVLPPTDFTQGFTVTVTDDQGGTFEKSTSNHITLERNMLKRMASMKVVPTYDDNVVVFEDPNFKAYCIANFDTDHDGKISKDEAQAVTRINVCTDEITTLKGIEAFSNLTHLICYGSSQYDYDLGQMTDNGHLAEMDISQNAALTYLYCYGNKLTSLNLSSNPELDTLNCSRNPLQSLDVSYNDKLRYLSCDDGQLTSLNVSQNTALTCLYCYNNQLTSLDVSNNPALTRIDCGDNQLSSLNVSQCPTLQNLYCSSNPLTSLDVSNTALTYLYCSGKLVTSEPGSDRQYTAYGTLSSLNVSGCVNLKQLNCSGHDPYLTTITGLEDCVNLEEFTGFYNNFQTLDFSHNTKLQSIYLAGNIHLSSLNVTQCTELNWMSLWDCRSLMSVDLSHNEKLEELWAYHLSNNDFQGNKTLKKLNVGAPASDFSLLSLINLEYLGIWNFTNLDFSNSTKITGLWLGTAGCTTVDLSPLTDLYSLTLGDDNGFETLDISNNSNLSSFSAQNGNTLKKLYVSLSQQIEGVTVNRSDEILNPATVILTHYDFTDPVFRSYMLSHFDYNHDGLISREEALSVESIDITSNAVASLAGIENCTNLRWLKCIGTDGNLGTGGLLSLDLSLNPNIEEVYVHNNKLASLDLSSCSKLERLNAGGNPLTRFSTTGLNSIKSLVLQNCTLEELEVTDLPLLEELNFADNKVAGTVNLTAVPNLQRLHAWNNKLTAVDLHACPELIDLQIGDSPITSLQINCPKLMVFNINNIHMEFPDLPDISQLPLTDLHLSTVAHQMPTGFLRNFPNLYSLNFCGYQGASIDLGQNQKLERVWCADMPNLEYLDLSAAPNITDIYAAGCGNLFIIYLANGTMLTNLQKDDHTSIVYK